jgi:hypothetical protein
MIFEQWYYELNVKCNHFQTTDYAKVGKIFNIFYMYLEIRLNMK